MLYNPAIPPNLGFLTWACSIAQTGLQYDRSCLCLLSVGVYLQTQQFRMLESTTWHDCVLSNFPRMSILTAETLQCNFWAVNRPRGKCHQDWGTIVHLAFLLRPVGDRGHGGRCNWWKKLPFQRSRQLTGKRAAVKMTLLANELVLEHKEQKWVQAESILSTYWCQDTPQDAHHAEMSNSQALA